MNDISYLALYEKYKTTIQTDTIMFNK